MYGDLVRRARVSRGLTQTQLAEISGIRQTNISAIEHGRRQPSAATLHQLLLACGFEVLAAAGDRVLAFPASPDDLAGDQPVAPPLDVPIDVRVRMLVGALDTAEATVRSRR